MLLTGLIPQNQSIEPDDSQSRTRIQTEKFFFFAMSKVKKRNQNTATNMFFFFWGLKVSVLECSIILPAKNFPQCTIILLAAPLSFFCPITGYAVVDFCNVAVWNKTARALHPLGIPYICGKVSNLKKSHLFKRSCIFFSHGSFERLTLFKLSVCSPHTIPSTLRKVAQVVHPSTVQETCPPQGPSTLKMPMQRCPCRLQGLIYAAGLDRCLGVTWMALAKWFLFFCHVHR